MIPAWAPNAHPLFVHFPIVLALLALAVDVLALVRVDPQADRASDGLYALAALAAASAYLSGRLAGADVFLPGGAHPLVDAHERWALVTTGALVGLAALRLFVRWRSGTRALRARIFLVALGVGAAVLVAETAERGARLVYEQGVGVIPGPVRVQGGTRDSN